MPVTTRNQERIALEQQKIAVEKPKIEIKKECCCPDIMYIVSSGNPNLYNQPLPDTYQEFFHTSLAESLGLCLMKLIRSTKSKCFGDEPIRVPPGTCMITRHVENATEVSTIMYKGNLHFVDYEHDEYQTVCPTEDQFFNLLCESRADDIYYQNFLLNVMLCNCANPSALDLGEISVPAMQNYLRYKMHPLVAGTWLDAFIVANAFHAELYIYDSMMPLHENNNTYLFSCRSFYNSPLPNNQKRPIWVLIRAYTGQNNFHKWYAITSELTRDMSYLYRTDDFSTKLIERIDS